MPCRNTILRAVFDSATVQAVEAGGIVNMPEVTSNSNCATASGGTITLRSPGDYEVHFNMTAVATAAGPVEVQMYRDGSPVPGAHAFGTAAAVGDNVPLSFSTVVTVECCGTDAITFRTAAATSVRVANAVVEQ